MQKMYSKSSRGDDVNKLKGPKEQTIRFLLDYSMALSVMENSNGKFEMFLKLNFG